MAINHFKREVWAGAILSNLRTSLVFGQDGVINRSYEGEVRGGASVRINSIGGLSVVDYTPNTDLDAPGALSDDKVTLTIDQLKAVQFQIDDVDAAQVNANLMGEATAEAAYALAKDIDSYIAGLMADGVAEANQLGEISPTAETAYETLVDLSVKLDEADCPSTGRWVVVTPAFHGLLLKDSRFVGAGTSGDVLANGMVGTAAGFRVLASNQTEAIVAGHSSAVTVASQIDKVEAFRLEKRFADGVKALHVYGAKVVRPTCLASAVIAAPAE